MEKKGRKVKCKNCGNLIFRSECYEYEYLDKNLNIKNRYYCNKKCCEENEKEKELINECYNLIDELLEMPCRTNIYFNKMYKPIREHYKMKVIHKFLKEEYSYIEVSLYKDFVSNNAKIKYFFAIMQDKINKYKDIVKKTKNDEIERDIELFDEEDFIPNQTLQRDKKRSINDILNSLQIDK